MGRVSEHWEVFLRTSGLPSLKHVRFESGVSLLLMECLLSVGHPIVSSSSSDNLSRWGPFFLAPFMEETQNSINLNEAQNRSEGG